MVAEPNTIEEDTSQDGVAAVDRALLIVTTLERSSEPMSLADLARQTGLYKSTLLRLIASLERGALVSRRSDNTYGLGHMAFRLGRAYERTHHLRECIYPVLEWLIAQGTESPSFHVVYDSKHRICLFRIDSAHPTLDNIRAGDLLPADRGAPAKVLRGLPGDPKIRGCDGLVQTSYGERQAACAAVAIPVFGSEGEIVGALSVSGPTERFSEAAAQSQAKLLVEAARRASQSLGGKWMPRR